MRSHCEAARLLEWLGELLKHGEGMDVDVVIIDEPGTQSTTSSVQITLHGVPGPLAGVELDAPRTEPDQRM